MCREFDSGRRLHNCSYRACALETGNIVNGYDTRSMLLNSINTIVLCGGGGGRAPEIPATKSATFDQIPHENVNVVGYIAQPPLLSEDR